ncbi:MAG: 1-(5-phosphoribosyl)-5-[(5-phosphoribosylamino)methylideneamino]imidazole-4-carboxamide isomerase [Bacteroidaceae bacterium]|nr:1-(5-phosphoribosyl)-5-[(5-phosphoribosylamino)methylideneamino]imidazole-4-carboxamide isomerase [Bacteroidaceae bacterium]
MIELIPAIDIIGGKCVRLTKGDYGSQTVYDLQPLDFAKEIEALGYRRLHMVDLDGARSSHVVNIEVLNEVATHTSLQIDFGGGIKTDADMEAVFENGAAFATIGSVAAKEPELMDSWIERYGADRLILGADVKDGFVCISGWKEKSRKRLMPFLQSYYAKGIRQVLCTDISKDGMLQGTAVELYKEIMQQMPDLHLIASGGVSCEEDITLLDSAGIPAVVFGKAIYEGKIDLKTLPLRSRAF